MSRATRSSDRPQARRPRAVSRPHDPAERQADHAADVVARGESVGGWSFGSVPVEAGVHREEKGKPPSDDEKLKQAAAKTAEAALETKAGKALVEKVKEDPLVRKATQFLDTTPGKVVAGGVIAAGVGGLAAAGQPLPFQAPAIPLDRVTPGLSAKVTVEGPVNAPTFVGLSLTYKEQVAKGKAGPTEKEQIAADVARLRAQQEQFKPQAQKDREKADEQAAIARMLALQSRRFGTSTLLPLGPGEKPRTVDLPKQDAAAEPAQKEQEDAPVQRRPASESTVADGAQATLDTGGVDEAVGSGGRPLDGATRRSMEARFGYDFGAVRIHDDARAVGAAADLDASAFTVGDDIVFGPGGYDPSTAGGRHLLAHELAHVVQQRHVGPGTIHRQKAGGGTATPARADYEMFVDEAIRYLASAADYYRAVAETSRVRTPGAAPAGLQRASAGGAGGADGAGSAGGAAAGPAPAGRVPSPAAADRTPAPGRSGTAAPVATAGAPGAPGAFTEDRLVAALEKLRQTYEGAQALVEAHLPTDDDRVRKLRHAYVAAAAGARAAATGMARANLVIIAAPKDNKDWFITNATAYARLYYGKGIHGEVVSLIRDVATVEELLDQVEKAEPNRLIGRIDIFCHGTIEPAHQMKLGKSWHRVGDFEAAAAARAGSSRTLATQSRFDGSSVIELHACRLGAPLGDPGKTGEPQTQGTDFLAGFGKALGGEQGQSVTGYRQRWVPRVFRFPGIRSPKQLAGRQRKSFDDLAVRTYDAVMAGSAEVQTLLTDAERQGGTLTRDRKVDIMEKLYEAGNGWIIGHQYSTKEPQSTDPVRDVAGKRDTFSNEKDWQSLVLTVKVPPAQVVP